MSPGTTRKPQPIPVLFAMALAALVLLAPSRAHAVLGNDPQAAQSAPLAKINLPQAIDELARFPQDVLVATPDTGLDLDHPEIAPRLYALPSPVAAPCQADYVFGGGCGAAPAVAAGAPGWDLIGTEDPCANGGFIEMPDADPSDPVGCSGHGTAVTGALGAAWNNGQGAHGVAPNARLIALRTCWDGDTCFQHVQPVAFDWAADRGARVISLSWSQEHYQATLDSIARNSNTLFVALAGGNGGPTNAEMDPLPYPCAAPLENILCVTTSGPDDGLACGPIGPTIVDIAVPTDGIVVPTNGGGTAAGGCATSFASPIAAGVATLLFGLVPEATPADVKAAILQGARPAAAWQGKSVTGGILDARGAVRAFQERFGLKKPTGGRGVVKGKGPKKKTKKRSARFTWTSEVPGASFQCKLDKGKYKACKSPKKVKRLAPGKHKFRVRAKLAGKVLPGTAKWKWKVLRG